MALWQSNFVKATLEARYPECEISLKHVITTGDKTQDSSAAIPLIGGKGLFTAELEECLVRGEIDIAVHSLKDLPTELPTHFTVGAIPQRSYVEDALISRCGRTLAELPAGAVVGTSSVRRSSQIVHARPDLKIAHIRGNVDTRLKKLHAEGGVYDAILLAQAGLDRLGIADRITEVLPLSVMVPAPGQGALGIECRSGDAEVLAILASLHHEPTARAVTAERAFLKALGAGCNTPVAAYAVNEARADGDYVVLTGRCLSPDGSRIIELMGEDRAGAEEALGMRLAHEALERGFSHICAAQ